MPVMRLVVAASLALVVSAGLSGCVTSIFVDTTLTTREFACEALAGSPKLLLEVRVDETTGFKPLAALVRLDEAIAEIGLRSAESIEVRVAPLDEVPSIWDDDAWKQELQRHSVRENRQTIALTMYWVADLPGNTTGEWIQPGVIALSDADIFAKGEAMDRSMQEVAVASLLHHVGHALGGVNRGIPMQANHEGQPGHDALATSVLHHAWHDADAFVWAANATYDGFPQAMRDDWIAAVNDPLVCP